jgi:peptidoglycan/LPS O-acetylase OafA/YrhL
MKFRELQNLRAIAAAFVVVDHSMRILGSSDSYTYIAWCFGDIGVAVFFVISGFIMVYASEKEFGQPGAPLRFATRRIERIVPLYWLVTLIAAASLLRNHVTPLLTKGAWVLKSLFFIPYPNSDGLIRPIHGVGWTLDYEMFFYAVFAACLALPSRRWAIGAAVAILTAIAAAGVAVAGPAWGDDPHNAATFITYPIILLFAVGMLLGAFGARLRTPLSIPHAATVMSLTLFGVILIFALAVKTYPVAIGWRFFVWGACSVCVVGVLVLDDPRRELGVYGRLMERLGDASYSTYLVHLFAIACVLKLDPARWIGAPATFVTVIVAAHLAGYVTHLAVERPLIAYFHRERQKRKALSPATA